MSGSLHSNFGQSAKSLLHLKKSHFTQKRSDFFMKNKQTRKLTLVNSTKKRKTKILHTSITLHKKVVIKKQTKRF